MGKVLIACEFSGVVRDAFLARGHHAISCDLLPTERKGNHIVGNVLSVLDGGWDLMIAHPPCTYLTCTGNKWFNPEYRDRFPNREQQREDAVAFFMAFAEARIPHICIENPVGIMSSRWRPADQVIDPTEFGHAANKKTCLWLKGLPRLIRETVDAPLFGVTQPQGERTYFKSGKSMPTWYVDATKDKNRASVRSKTFEGIANAMADQWGALLNA
jgi:hypothetical protein